MVEDTRFLWESTAGHEEMVKQALQLSKDMLKAREEEVALNAASASQQINFKLPDSGDVVISALRCIIAARAFDGKLLGCKDHSILNTAANQQEEGNADGVAAEPPPATGTPEIVLPGVQEHALQLAISYAYSGSVDIKDGNWKELLIVADSLGLHGLKGVVETFMRQAGAVTDKTVLDVLNHANKYAASGLKEYCLGIIDSTPSTAFSIPSFLHLPKDVVKQIISRDALKADELSIFNAVLAWGHAQLETNMAKQQQEQQPQQQGEGADAPVSGEDVSKPDEETLGQVLEGVVDFVRFPLISPENLRDVVQPSLMGQGQAIEHLILEGYQHHALVKVGQPSKVDESKTRPRAGTNASGKQSIQKTAGGEKGISAADALLHAQRTGRWLRSLPPNVERISMASMRLGEYDAVLLADFLKSRGRSVLELDLKCNSLSCSAIKPVLDALVNCPRLVGLALGENPLGAEAGSVVASVLLSGSLSGLEKLGLGGTRLGDEGLLALAPAVAAHTSLRVVGVSANGLTMRGATGFVEAMRAHSGVMMVVMGGNGLTEADTRKLQGMCREGLTLKFI